MPDGIFEDSRIKTTYAIDVIFDGLSLDRELQNFLFLNGYDWGIHNLFLLLTRLAKFGTKNFVICIRSDPAP